MPRYLPLVATTALLTAAATIAQPQTTTGTTDASTTSATPTTPTTGQMSTPATNPSGTTTGAATQGDAAATASTAASQLHDVDAEFLRKALEANRMEIASAQAALGNAERAETKATARTLLDDHQQSSQKLQQLASRKGWSMPAASTTAESDQARMETAGAGFDDRFMAEQIRMHREAISLYRQQVSSGSDPDLRQFARDQLPHLEHHLEMLQGSNTRM
jgi:putative membrane protein